MGRRRWLRVAVLGLALVATAGCCTTERKDRYVSPRAMDDVDSCRRVWLDDYKADTRSFLDHYAGNTDMWLDHYRCDWLGRSGTPCR
jgi:hypothetical protein